MVFSSTIFIFIFLPICLAGYYILRKNNVRNIFLLVMSLIFYAWGEPRFVIILMVSITANYFFALLIDHFRDRNAAVRALVVLMLVYNLGLLFVFKYLCFMIKNVNVLAGDRLRVPDIVLPIGISFFTFQAISYVLDVYVGTAKVQKNILNLALYISFFPQLIAGPIVRYNSIEEQIGCRHESAELFVSGIKRFTVGLAKKTVISNVIAVMVDEVFLMDPHARTGLLAWVGIVSYCIQLYYDFSGYSDMAIGLGRMFGFEFDENFNYPYISKSIGEYWTRWHISLSVWFRDYLYTPLLMKFVRKKWPITVCNFFALLITWFLCGVWHGAAWNYVLYGLYYFIFIFAEHVINDRAKEKRKRLHIKKKPESRIHAAGMHVYTLSVILFGQLIFRSTGISSLVKYIGSMFGAYRNPLMDSYSASTIFQYLPVLLLGIFFAMPVGKWAVAHIHKRYPAAEAAGYILLLLTGISFTVSSTYNPFIYFNF